MTAEYRFKVVMLGDGAVGKTALTNMFTQGHFISEYKRTIGSDFAVKRVSVPQRNAQVTLQVWDLAGQPRFEIVRQSFYRGARGGLLVYDVTRRRTFLNLDHWRQETKNSLSREIPLVVVANKVDLTGARVVTREEGEQYAAKSGLIYVEASALTGQNVEDAFVELCVEMIDESKSEARSQTG
ncbi:MAG: Rab family GTPase [Candidatus Thorarchaeota archaeon]